MLCWCGERMPWILFGSSWFAYLSALSWLWSGHKGLLWPMLWKSGFCSQLGADHASDGWDLQWLLSSLMEKHTCTRAMHTMHARRYDMHVSTYHISAYFAITALGSSMPVYSRIIWRNSWLSIARSKSLLALSERSCRVRKLGESAYEHLYFCEQWWSLLYHLRNTGASECACAGEYAC